MGRKFEAERAIVHAQSRQLTNANFTLRNIDFFVNNMKHSEINVVSIKWSVGNFLNAAEQAAIARKYKPGEFLLEADYIDPAAEAILKDKGGRKY